MDKVVLVTGGGRGIGAATSILLGQQGYLVCVNYRKDQESAERVVSNIRAHGGQALAVQADVAVEEQVRAMFDLITETFGHVTHLVNNAGILFTQSTLSDISVERFNQVLQTNVIGCFLCCKEALKNMPESGAIVNVSSAASRTGAPNEYVDYAASKGAMDSLTKGLSLEVAAKGIRVNSVRPGCIHTEMHKDGGEANRVNRLANKIPLQRGGTAEEVAQSIAWLLSDEASFVTGSFIDIAGGL
ncbi:MAG TPA: KR domain-containing protein [Vibrio sp.]|uniref:SDR family oxidoreductase n=1 Tax=Vibrio TaxID=662 RepID=UPI0004267414|nr:MULTISPECIES: SDR family oxidoreductase [Vibrio]HCH01116.1 KR domain-containing protein [Vibrio sp.]